MATLARTFDSPLDTHHLAPTISRALTSHGGLGQTLLRLTLALVLLPHGMQHLFGLFGGYGFRGTLAWMTGTLGIPAPLAAAGIVLEFVGPALLVVGAGSRLWGAALAIFMVTAAVTHVPHGFFMNWFGGLPAGTEGFEYHLLAIAMSASIAVNGGGRFSLDALVARRLRAR